MQQRTIAPPEDDRHLRARCSLKGLSVGDAFGDQIFGPTDTVLSRIEARLLPPPPWPYTDDTEMALSMISSLWQAGAIDLDRLAASFVEQYNPSRGYGPAMHRLLATIRAGSPWQEAVPNQFAGQGSFGNGAAMRVAPVGAFFAEDLGMVADQATRSALVTHTHPEAIAGSVAVAIAAARAWKLGQSGARPTRAEFLDLIIPFVPTSEVRWKICWARDLAATTAVESAAAILGNGVGLSAQATVPFAVWCAGEQLTNYEEALWLTVRGLGDRDTTCAIVGGIVALYTGLEGIPSSWTQAREPLPTWPFGE